MTSEKEVPSRFVFKRVWRLSGSVAGLALVAVAGVAAAVALVFGAGSRSDAPQALMPGISTDGRTTKWCPEVPVGPLISGASFGDLATGPGLILRMNHAIYAERNADAARSVFAPEAAVASPAETRAALAALPSSVEYCVRITPLVANRFAVSVEERSGDGRVQLWDTVVATGRQGDGRLLITAVTPAGDNE